MNFEDYFFLGKLLKPHGFDGRMNAYIDTDNPNEYRELKLVYVNFNNNLVPYFITHIHLLNNKAIISFNDIDNFEKAEKLSQKEMFLPVSELPVRSGNKFYFHEVIGFKIIDQDFGAIGTIQDILEYPNQAVMQIIYNQISIPGILTHPLISLFS